MALICAAVIGLGRTAVLVALSKFDAGPRPQAVLAWNPRDGDALASQAERTLAMARSPAQIDEVRRLAARALARSPLEVGAVRLLALTAERQGDPARAERLMTIAGRRSLRDGPTHAWLFDHWFRRAAWPAAMTHADILLRTHPAAGAAIDPSVISAISAVPEARRILVARLAAAPAWRISFLADLAKSGDDTTPLLAVLTDLQRAGSKLSDDEMLNVLMPLVYRHQFDEAYLIWTQSLPPKALATLGNVYDADFDGMPGPPPFNWKLTQPSGGAVEIVPSPTGGAGRMLSVHLYDAPADPLAVQLLVLPPGRYRLSARSRNEAESAGAMTWSVRCDGGAVVARVSSGGGAGQWTSGAASFDVPAEGCAGQWLELRTAPGASFQGAGVWWDKLSINRQDG